MERENTIAIVTDSGASIGPKFPEAIQYNVTIVPLEVRFWDGTKYVSYSDADIKPEDFYRRMSSDKRLPQTSGAVPGRFVDTYRNLSERTRSIISIHITSKLSGVCESAITAKNIVQEEEPKTEIEVKDKPRSLLP